jgi:hypothetical protein
MAMTTARTRPPATLAVRVVLTALGAAGLIVGAFLKWLDDTKGYKGSWRVYWANNAPSGVSFWKSAGAVMIVLAIVAIIGLALRTGVLTSLAGALGIVAFVLFAVNVYRRTSLNIGDFKVGIWVCLAGGVLALIGGFFGNRAVVVAAPPAGTVSPTTPPPPPA